LWVLIYSEATLALIHLWLGGFIIVQNAASYLLITSSFAPLSFQVNHFSVAGWMGARVFVNLRWFFPLVLNLVFLSLISQVFEWSDVVFWAGLHLFFAILFSVLFTSLHELRYRKIYA
jgi:hypothetical protein